MEVTECPICCNYSLEELNNGFFKTPCCNQYIHKECFDNSLKSTNGTCPFCRKDNNTQIEIININDNITDLIIINNNYYRINKCCCCLIIFLIFNFTWVPITLVYQINQNKKFIGNFHFNNTIIN